MSVARIDSIESAIFPVSSSVIASEYGSSPDEQADDHSRTRDERLRNSSRTCAASVLSCARSRKKYVSLFESADARSLHSSSRRWSKRRNWTYAAYVSKPRLAKRVESRLSS